MNNKTLLTLCTMDGTWHSLAAIATAATALHGEIPTSETLLTDLRDLYRAGHLHYREDAGCQEFQRVETGLGGIAIASDGYLLIDDREAAGYRKRQPRVGYLNKRRGVWIPNITDKTFSVPAIPHKISASLDAAFNWCATVGIWKGNQ